MNLVEMTDEEILKIANPIWNGLVESSNKKDYVKHLSTQKHKILIDTNEKSPKSPKYLSVKFVSIQRVIRKIIKNIYRR